MLCQCLYKSEWYRAATPHAKWLLNNSNKPEELFISATIFMANRNFDQAYHAICHSLEISQNIDTVHDQALYLSQYNCDWHLFQKLATHYQENHQTNKSENIHESAFSNITWCMDEKINKQTAQATTLHEFGKKSALFDHSIIRHPRCLRIGYVSSDFYNHATLQLMAGVFEKHDRKTFEIFAYCHSRADQSEQRQRFVNAIDNLVDITNLSDEEAARRIYSDAIDILIDLKGPTQGSRLGIFTLTPAPISASYLGFPGSSGADFIDYIISDGIVTPESSKPFYTEKLCRLPETYQCNDNARAIAANPISRDEHTLPKNGVIFCCFNQPYKIEEVAFTHWMRILSAIPESVLWLLETGELAKQNLRAEAQKRGISADRLIFAPKTATALHLARISLADIALDTRIYNGHTTTSDALWAGVPVLTVPGTHFASRVSASLLTACGMSELIQPDWETLCETAIALARSPERLRALKEKLVQMRLQAPLFDTERFTRHLERAYAMMAERWQTGLPPADIDVPALPQREVPFADCIPTVEVNLDATTDGDTEKWRHPQEKCPVCGGEDLAGERIAQLEFESEAATSLPQRIHWGQCADCEHVYTLDYWSEDAQEQLNEMCPSERSDPSMLHRHDAGQLVERAFANAGGWRALRQRGYPLVWLEVDPDTPWVYASALEQGAALTGLSASYRMSERLQTLGGQTAHADFLDLEISGQTIEVISLQGALETTPFPRDYLQKAFSLLASGGVLLASISNSASPYWKMKETEDEMACWGNPLRQQLFSTENLLRLIEDCGFRVMESHACASRLAGVSLIAIRP